jgi:hypothetical protein
MLLNKKGTDKMKALLDQVQSYLIEEDPYCAMEDYQIPLIPTTQTFVQFGKEVDSGLSPLSGLLKYCNNAVNVVKSGVEKNVSNIPIVIHIGEKMGQIIMALRYVIDVNKLSEAELTLLEDSEKSAMSWLENKERQIVLKDVEARVSIVKTNLSEGGVMHVLRNREDVLRPLMSWG